MYLQQIRNATIFLYYGGKTFLIDPILTNPVFFKKFLDFIKWDHIQIIVKIRMNVSAKYCCATHELRLHQNDRCKRFTLF